LIKRAFPAHHAKPVDSWSRPPTVSVPLNSVSTGNTSRRNTNLKQLNYNNFQKIHVFSFESLSLTVSVLLFPICSFFKEKNRKENTSKTKSQKVASIFEEQKFLSK
jgi:hypothetical protein